MKAAATMVLVTVAFLCLCSSPVYWLVRPLFLFPVALLLFSCSRSLSSAFVFPLRFPGSLFVHVIFSAFPFFVCVCPFCLGLVFFFFSLALTCSVFLCFFFLFLALFWVDFSCAGMKMMAGLISDSFLPFSLSPWVFFFVFVLCFALLVSSLISGSCFFQSPVRSSPLFLFEETRGYLTSTPLFFFAVHSL